MNKRRWIAVLIAIGVALISLTGIAINSVNDSQEEALSSLLSSQESLKESIITPGDSSQKIAKITIDGVIADTQDNNLFSSSGYNHQQTLEMIKKIDNDDTVKAVLLEVNSPGGGVYESNELAKALQKLQAHHKPVYVNMKNMAASGGYYISAAADKIYASEETVTGSIGVIMSGMNYASLLDKLGVKDQTYKSGALKDMGSSTRATTPEEAKVMQEHVDRAYNRFVDVVSKGRKMDIETVKKLADGRIYDGLQAKENGLVDEIGFEEDCLADLQNKYDLKDAQVIEYTTNTPNFLASWLNQAKTNLLKPQASTEDAVKAIVQAIGTPQAPKAMYYYGG
ncbi:signal peptide peptidase SppA [Enterococcus cecorum]|uniref:signal peptide peptidase SppA n=1 Tax=Enterococcus cecorum TaxID=44008 RepID=UPI000DE9814A|nr:signal peptide peptidase SppA [Enterococcus cecorum]RBR36836.1 signal peptide peptidase SppA, 36K type [Enterococcus cecorum]RBR39361.1 signal peptide peptidase SppA, 36K type [Enterococcus cecorum]